MNRDLAKIIGAIGVVALFLAIRLGPREFYYLTHESGEGGSGFKEKVARYENNDFEKMAFEDVTPPPLGGHMSVGTRGPFFMMLKIDRGQGPEERDPRYPGDRDKIQFTVTGGKGAVKPITSGKNLWDNLTLFQKTYTLTADDRGQVIAVFYPSVFSFENEYAIRAVVLNNPRLSGEIQFFWRPYPLDEEDFKKTIHKFVDWNNRSRMINRSAQVTVKTWNQAAATVTGDENLEPTPTATSGILTVYNGRSEYQGQFEHSSDITYDSFMKEMGFKPWAYSDSNVVFIKRGDNSYDFWSYEEDGGVLRESISIPSLDRIDSSESDLEYKEVNGTLFPSYQADMVYSGKDLTRKTESRMVVTLSPDTGGN